VQRHGKRRHVRCRLWRPWVESRPGRGICR
jgi:hypothetical protein